MKNKTIKGHKTPVDVYLASTWDMARLEAKKRILRGYKATVAYSKKNGRWIVEVYE